MDKYEFQINYYFNLYKDEPLSNSKDFKIRFIKKHGNFKYLNEVILRINRYQVKKYGNGLIRFTDYKTPEQLEKQTLNARQRWHRKRETKHE